MHSKGRNRIITRTKRNAGALMMIFTIQALLFCDTTQALSKNSQDLSKLRSKLLTLKKQIESVLTEIDEDSTLEPNETIQRTEASIEEFREGTSSTEEGTETTTEFVTTESIGLTGDEVFVLTNGTAAFEHWKKPVEKKLRIFFYNVTNVLDFVDNGSKPILNEVGPYTYREITEKVNLAVHENGSLSYNLKKIYLFDSENSVGTEEDRLHMLNMVMLTSTSKMKYAPRYLRLAITSMFEVIRSRPFGEVPVGEFLWGYQDYYLKLETFTGTRDDGIDEFGIFTGRNRTGKNHYTVLSGLGDIDAVNKIESINGKTHLPHWKTEQCNAIAGTDGSLFGPHLSKNDTVNVYAEDLCRTIPHRFSDEVTTPAGTLAYRFTPFEDVFADVDKNAENECFCPEGPPCAPSELFNVSLCRSLIPGSPILVSLPHFHKADSKLSEPFLGLSQPNPKKDTSYIDLDPETGTVLGSKTSYQINFAISAVPDIKQVAVFRDDTIFPILWFEVIQESKNSS